MTTNEANSYNLWYRRPRHPDCSNMVQLLDLETKLSFSAIRFSKETFRLYMKRGQKRNINRTEITDVIQFFGIVYSDV